jgi:hypothetical protein
MTKSVTFAIEHNKIHETYSRHEYDRFQIDSVVYLHSYNRLSWLDMSVIYFELNQYKLKEMEVHELSKSNTRLHKSLLDL